MANHDWVEYIAKIYEDISEIKGELREIKADVEWLKARVKAGNNNRFDKFLKWIMIVWISILSALVGVSIHVPH